MSDAEDRLLSFELGGTIYALPIEGVLEVAEMGRVTCIPALPRECAAVMNWHGDALPVVNPHLVLADEAGEGGDADDPGEPTAASGIEAEHVLVVPDAGGESARLGLPIDRVLGLVEGRGRRAGTGSLVAERRSLGRRVMNVLDPRQLVERAEGIIERSAL